MAKDLTDKEKFLRKMCLHFAKTENLVLFDVRNYIFGDLAPVYFEDQQNRLEPEDIERWMKDRENYRHYKDNIVLQTCIAKYWAQPGRLNYDYDDSLFCTCVFQMLSQKFFPGKKCVTKRNDRNPHEYVIITGDSEEYRGDTMNSWKTTLIEFFRLFGDDYLKGLVKNTKGENFGKWRVPDEPRNLDWIRLLCNPENYKKYIPFYITEFMELVYTIGNFLPVPEGFNKGRNAPTKDYWDITLLSIYEYYKGNGAESKLAALFEKDAIRNWLNRFGGWDNFVIKNFMNPFVDKCGNHFGRPKELWDGHLEKFEQEDDSLPKTLEQFEQFFVNARVRILARGRLMADALRKPESDKN